MTALQSNDRFMESTWVSVEHSVDGLAGIFDDVVRDSIEISDEAHVHREGVAGDRVPDGREVGLPDPRTDTEHVQMRMPTVGVRIVLHLQETNAAFDRVFPEGVSAKGTEVLEEAIDLETESLIAVAKGQGDEAHGEAVEASAEVGSNDPGAVPLAGAAPTVAACIGANLDLAWVGDGAVDPGSITACAEAIEPLASSKSRLEC